jgi:TolB-like protein/tRNA A-37 threonylcarbamoyl transferase component Bud32
MQPTARQSSTCPTCGAALEETFGGGPGCMFCLLHAGIGSEQETAHDSTPDGSEGGVRFGVYEIDCHADGSLYELGRGAMGVTYRATDTSLQRKVALKIIKTDIAERNADARERFVREARAAAALRHENIAVIHQFGMRLETGQYFYAMELIEGETLDERVHRAGPLDARITIGIGEQVTSALAAAEKHGLVHRDLKPANLMLVNADDSGAIGNDQARFKRSKIRALRKRGIPVVKIIDFGLAKAFHTAADPKSLTHDRFVGTPAFASPEQFEHSALDVRSDIYSLGETLWFALTGKPPFAGHSLSEIHRAQKSNPPPVEQLKAAHVPHGLRTLLGSMLSFEPGSRPGTRELASRLQRCSPETRSVRRTRLGLAAAFTLILGAAGFFAFRSLQTPNLGLNPLVPEKSIAVLPFENLSADQENAFFADGVQDEILTDLAKVADLKVISRTSVMQYKSGTERNLRDIANALGVAHVLEGSVQRAGNRVRVSAQLIDARTDMHIWAERYDRDLADVFALESELAEEIVAKLKSRLSAEEKAAIEKPPTHDLVAYDLYARAKVLVDAISFNNARANQDLLEAVTLLDQAIARDPEFFHAYYQLARAHDEIYSFGIDHTPSRLAFAEAALEAVLRLRPNSGEAHLASAQHRYMALRDYDRARQELAIARRAISNEPFAFVLSGFIDRRQGRWGDSTKELVQALQLDPQNIFILQQLSFTYHYQRRFKEMVGVLDRVLALDPTDANTRLKRAVAELEWHADSRPLHSAIESILANDPSAAAIVSDRWIGLALCERDGIAAEHALASLPFDGCREGSLGFPRAWCEGLVARARGDGASARDAFTRARAEVEPIVRHQPDYPEELCVLGMIDAALGRKANAIQEGRRAAELLPITKDAIDGAVLIQYLAVIYAWTGENQLALEQLAAVVGVPSDVNYGYLRLHPLWDPLRHEPRFQRIVASLAPEARQQ